MYSSFAKCYDALMHDVPYKKWALFYKALMKKRGIKKGARVLEIACGTGRLSELLADDFDLSCLDISEEMLSLCESRLRRAGKCAHIMRGDMTRLCFFEDFDAVLISCDGLNYILDEEKLKSTFEGCKKALRPGGALLFDISSEYKLRELLSDQSLFEQRENYSYIWHNSELEGSKIELELEVFYRNEQGSFDRIIENQRQRAWSEGDIKSALEKAGFYKIQAFGDKHFSNIKHDENRLHFSAERK